MHVPRRAVVAATGPLFRYALDPRRSVALQRRLVDLGAAVLRPPDGTHVEPVRLAQRSAERVTFGASHRPRAVLYLHGGGYVVGSPRTARALAGQLARASGAAVYVLDYRLAPQYPYPAALDDVVAAFGHLVDVAGFDPSRVALAGDSAGGGLAVAAARTLTDRGRRPGALVLLSPWTDPGDRDLVARDLVLSKAWLVWCAEQYRGTADPREPGYAPLRAELAGLPPMLIHSGTQELLHPQITRFADRLRAAGVAVTSVGSATMWHSGHLLAGRLRESTSAVRDVGVFVRARLDATPVERG
jgi:monoterpene epsilon-lactone hydrolase